MLGGMPSKGEEDNESNILEEKKDSGGHKGRRV